MKLRASGASLSRVLPAIAFVVCAVAGVDAQRPAVAVAGIVVDATGAVLPNATVELTTPVGAAVESTTTDTTGAFRFDRVAPGRYDLRVAFEGFRPTTVHVTVGTRPPSPLRITLPLATLTQEITVSNAPQVAANTTNNLDAVTVDQGMLESLPVFDQDYIATLSRFLDTGSIATGGVTIVVNGMEVNALNVSASAVQQIKINQDPYSAEYSRPGRGRIEILTKPGSREYHGEGKVIVRDARLDARNAFAAVRPPEERRIFEGMVGGPLGHGRSSFTVSGDRQSDDQQAIVFALGPNGDIRQNAPQPNSRVLVAGSITHQRGDSTTMSVRSSYEDERSINRGVGGVTLPSAGTNFEHREEDLVYNQQTVLRPSLLNQFQILVGSETEPTTSVSAAPGLVVSGAFTGGGAQGNLLRTEHHIQAAESLTWTHRGHLVQAGFQVPDWSRRRFDDQTNVGGTFYFANLAAYEQALPYSFVQQRGNGHVVLLEKVFGLYVKDDWQVSRSLSASFGLRYDWENYFHDNNNLAPRVSFALAPGGTKTNVVRGGAGIFYDKTGPVPIADMLHFQPGGLQRIVVTNPAYPDPFRAAGAVSSVPPSIVQFAPDIRIPYTLQFSLGLEHQLQKTTTVALTYIGSRGYDLFRSRDANAPPPPLYLARPNAAYGVVRQIESAAHQQSDSLQATLRGKLTPWFTGQMQYTLGRAYNNTGGLSWFPANDYQLSGEWARADFDRRHRFLLLGRMSAAKAADVGVSLTLQSGPPFNETLGADLYNNGRGNARPPGIARNSLEASGYADLDLRVSRDVTFAKGTPRARTLTVALDAFNVVNQVNYASYVGTVTSPFFGRAVSARAPRQLQVSMRVKF